MSAFTEYSVGYNRASKRGRGNADGYPCIIFLFGINVACTVAVRLGGILFGQGIDGSCVKLGTTGSAGLIFTSRNTDLSLFFNNPFAFGMSKGGYLAIGVGCVTKASDL